MKIKMGLVLPDIHHPYHNKGCMNAIFSWLRDYGKKLSYLVLLGDQMDFECISHWMKDRTRQLEGKRLKKDYNIFDKEILTPLEMAVNKRCKKVYFFGNHEDWVRMAIDELPQTEGFWEIEDNLYLKKRRWRIVPFNGVYKIGHLWLIHGLYTNQYHAAKTVNVYCRSIIYGHDHDMQEHTKIVPVDVHDVHKAHCIGCLCDKNPSYMHNRPNKWVHGFTILEVSDNGEFTEHTINIINGKFRWNGKLYGG